MIHQHLPSHIPALAVTSSGLLLCLVVCSAVKDDCARLRRILWW